MLDALRSESAATATAVATLIASHSSGNTIARTVCSDALFPLFPANVKEIGDSLVQIGNNIESHEAKNFLLAIGHTVETACRELTQQGEPAETND